MADNDNVGSPIGSEIARGRRIAVNARIDQAFALRDDLGPFEICLAVHCPGRLALDKDIDRARPAAAAAIYDDKVRQRVGVQISDLDVLGPAQKINGRCRPECPVAAVQKDRKTA